MGSILDFIAKNFMHVAPILIAGFVGVAIIAERARALFWVYTMRGQDSFFDKLRSLVASNRMQEALALCNYRLPSPIAKVAKEGVLRAHLPEEAISDGLHLMVGDATQAIQRRTGFLSMIANVATLLGLVGTIAGLIASFQAVGNASAQEKAALLANGISTAMNATLLGLGVAIPCMVAFSFLTNKANRLCAEIEHSAVRVLDILRARYYAPQQQQQGGQGSKEGQLAEVRQIRRGVA